MCSCTASPGMQPPTSACSVAVDCSTCSCRTFCRMRRAGTATSCGLLSALARCEARRTCQSLARAASAASVLTGGGMRATQRWAWHVSCSGSDASTQQCSSTSWFEVSQTSPSVLRSSGFRDQRSCRGQSCRLKLNVCTRLCCRERDLTLFDRFHATPTRRCTAAYFTLFAIRMMPRATGRRHRRRPATAPALLRPDRSSRYGRWDGAGERGSRVTRPRRSNLKTTTYEVCDDSGLIECRVRVLTAVSRRIN